MLLFSDGAPDSPSPPNERAGKWRFAGGTPRGSSKLWGNWHGESYLRLPLPELMKT